MKRVGTKSKRGCVEEWRKLRNPESARIPHATGQVTSTSSKSIWTGEEEALLNNARCSLEKRWNQLGEALEKGPWEDFYRLPASLACHAKTKETEIRKYRTSGNLFQSKEERSRRMNPS